MNDALEAFEQWWVEHEYFLRDSTRTGIKYTAESAFVAVIYVMNVAPTRLTTWCLVGIRVGDKIKL